MTHVHPRSAPLARARAGRRRAASLVLAGVGLLLAVTVSVTPASAEPPPVGLGTATSFAVLAGSGITNTGPTTITGDVGSFETTTQTGFGSVTLLGTNHFGDAVTQGAKVDLRTAYNDAFGRTPATSIPVELGGTTLLAGVYTSPTLGLTGTLTLDAQGDPDAHFIFQAGSTLITESNSQVVLINGANPCQVVWQVGSSATFKTGTSFAGDVLAEISITAQTTATFRGRLLALGGAVTLDTNTISRSTCSAPPATTVPTTPTTTGDAVPTTDATGTPTTPDVATGASGTTATGGTATGGVAAPDGTGAPGTPTGTPLTATGTGTPTALTGGGTPTGSGAPSLPATGGPYAAVAAFGITLVALGAGLHRHTRAPRPAHLRKG